MQGATGVRGHTARHRMVFSAASAVVLGLTLSACGPLTLGRTSAAPSPAVAGGQSPSATSTATATSTGDAATEPVPTMTADPLTPERPAPTTTPAPGGAASGTPTAGAGAPTDGAATVSPVTAPPTPGPAGGKGPVNGSCERTLPAYPVLEPGARGGAVRALQCLLDDADYGPVSVDGVYGAETRAAVRRVEASLEGPPAHPGRIDAGTWVLVISRSLGDVTLQLGSQGPDVVTLQRALRAAGATVAIDGRFGAQTKKAVQRLQDANRVGADGVVRDETLFLLKMGATIG